MKKENREWFDQVYEFTEGVLPFGFATGIPTIEEIKKMTRELYDERTMQKIQEKSSYFLKKVPPEEDFLEEKKRVLKRLLPELAKRLPFIDTVIMFGRMVGDIDIGLIADYNDIEDRVISELRGDKKIFRKYPIVDWNAMDYFISRTGEEFCKKLINSRLIAEQKYLFSPCEYCYVRSTIDNAMILWGDENITISILDTLDKKMVESINFLNMTEKLKYNKI